MAEYFGGDYIRTVLKDDAPVIAIVTSKNYIFNALLVPESVPAGIPTINYYTADLYDGGLNYFSRRWSIDCRAETQAVSQNLAYAVFEALNRKDTVIIDGKKYFSVCQILQTLPPVDDADVYNTPVQILLRRTL